jgi:hypothetical protein
MFHIASTSILLFAFFSSAAAQEPATETQDQKPAVLVDDFKPDPGWKQLCDDLWVDPKTRTVIMRGRVCLREGSLEHFICLDRTKEHESILSTKAEPRLIHAALLLAAGDPGHPVRYRPKFQEPSGPKVVIEVEYLEKDKPKRVDARTWIKDDKSKQALETTWVFAGSQFFQDPDTKKTVYGADGGDLVTVANFPTAILDLPIVSSNSDADRGFSAWTDRIPQRGTPVTIYMSAEKP